MGRHTVLLLRALLRSVRSARSATRPLRGGFGTLGAPSAAGTGVPPVRMGSFPPVGASGRGVAGSGGGTTRSASDGLRSATQE